MRLPTGSTSRATLLLMAWMPWLSGCSKAHAGADEALLDLSLPTALVRAGDEHKAVFIDFTAAWCGPCKRLAATTLRDPDVRAWLLGHTVPIRVDIDEQEDLAKEFGIRSVPTMLFLSPQRQVLGRISGYCDKDKFLREAEQRLAGRSASADAEARARSAPDDADAQYTLFRAYVSEGANDKAMPIAEAYWRQSRGTGHEGVRLSFFLAEMNGLAHDSAPAEAMLQRWLQEAAHQLEGKDALSTVDEFAALANALKDRDAILAAADKLTAAGRSGRATLHALAAKAADVFVAQKRYQDVVAAGVCDPDSLKMTRDMYLMTLGMHADKDSAEAGEAERFAKGKFLDDAACAFEALAGVGKTDDALAVARLAIGPDGAEGATERLAAAAKRAGNAALERAVRDLH